MALTGALFSGVSGINSNGNAMNIIGDNIANVNTVGFRSSRAVFYDLLSADIGGVKIGTGSRLAGANRLFTQGGVETTSNLTDLAIQGRGLFVLTDAQGLRFYSRAGAFHLDQGGTLVNSLGLRVQGVQLDGSGNPISSLTDIVINGRLTLPPQETSAISLTMNLNATATAPATALPADAVGTEAAPGAWFAASNFSTVVTVVDSLGAPHDMTFLFSKTATANEWDYRVVVNGGEVSGGTAGQMYQVNGAGGKLAFNPDGTLDLSALTNTAITQIGSIAWTNGANPQTIAAADVQFTGSTQFALPSAVTSLSQDGTQSGSVSGISIGTDGTVTGLFSSGRTQPIFRVALADFSNLEGLNHVGNTLFTQSQESGDPLFGNPSDGGFGTLLSGTLELSTVDLASEFVKMVTTQRGFQASSRTITVTDSLLEEVANLKR